MSLCLVLINEKYISTSLGSPSSFIFQNLRIKINIAKLINTLESFNLVVFRRRRKKWVGRRRRRVQMRRRRKRRKKVRKTRVRKTMVVETEDGVIGMRKNGDGGGDWVFREREREIERGIEG
jgi:hypothetical protein